jgi:hypothetical protein
MQHTPPPHKPWNVVFNKGHAPQLIDFGTDSLGWTKHIEHVRREGRFHISNARNNVKTPFDPGYGIFDD